MGIVLIVGGVALGVGLIVLLVIRRRNRIAAGLPVFGDGHLWKKKKP